MVTCGFAHIEFAVVFDDAFAIFSESFIVEPHGGGHAVYPVEHNVGQHLVLCESALDVSSTITPHPEFLRRKQNLYLEGGGEGQGEPPTSMT